MVPALPSFGIVWRTLCVLAVGGLGGLLAARIGAPMPWMLGALFANAGLVLIWSPPALLRDYSFPLGFRTCFVALIGVMIGTQVTPDLMALAPDLTLTLTALVAFVALAQFGNMLIFRRIGGYDRATAFYAAAPGGLMESILFGERAGADLRILTVQQFLRIIVVITLLPLGLSLWLGQTVGSAAGLQAMGGGAPVGPGNLALITGIAIVGLTAGQPLRLPAAHLTGPLLLTAGLNASGVVDLHLPVWLIAVAQLVIGASLGLRFKGVSLRLLRRSLGLSLLSVLFMLLLGGLFAMALHRATGIEFLHLLISFAPGGVAEMSVIALSLAANPALVSLHHVVRILLTVVQMPLAARLFLGQKA